MLTRNVGGYKILNTTGALAKLSNRPDLTPQAREAVVGQVRERLEYKMSGRQLQSFDKGVLMSALAGVESFNGAIHTPGLSRILKDLIIPSGKQRFLEGFDSSLRKMLDRADSSQLDMLAGTRRNDLLSMVVKAKNISVDSLVGIALELRQPATEAFNRMERDGLLCPERLAALSASMDPEVVARVANNDQTSTDTLVEMIMSVKGDRPSVGQAIHNAFSSLLNKGPLAEDQLNSLKSSQDSYVRLGAAVLEGEDKNLLTKAALTGSELALPAYERMHVKGMLSSSILGRLADSRNEEVLAEIANNPETPNEALVKIAMRKKRIAADSFNRLFEAGALTKWILSDLSNSENEYVLIRTAENAMTPMKNVAEIISKLFNRYKQGHGTTKMANGDALLMSDLHSLKNVIFAAQADRANEIMKELREIDPALAGMIEILA